MSISLGDAVMVFRGETGDLDAAFQKVPANAEKAFGAGSEFIAQFNEELDATGENVKFAGEKILSLTDAFRILSVQGPERLKAKLDDAKNAFNTLQSAGVTASGTLLQAQAKLVEREIAYRKAIGDSTTELQRQLTALQAQYAALGNPVQSLGQDFKFAGATAQTAGEAAAEAGIAIEAAGEKGASAFHQTRGAIDLAAEEVGIHLPRELKSFLSSLGPIQGLLSSAFSAFAIVALTEVIIEATKKTTEWVAETFIFTEAQKNLNNVLVESNKAIIGYNDSLKELIRQRESLGKTTAEQAAIKVRFSIEDEKKVADDLRLINDELFALRKGFADLPDVITTVNNKLRELHKDASEEDLKKLLLPSDADQQTVLGALASLNGKLTAQQKEFNFKRTTAEDEEGLALTALQNSFDTATINAHLAANSARLEIEHEHARIVLALQGASYSDQIQEQKNFEQRKYQAQLSAQAALLEVLKRDPTKNVTEIIAANAKIQELERQHEAKILADLATFAEKRRAILEEAQRPGDQSPLIAALPSAEKFTNAFIDPITGAYKQGMDLIETDTTIAIAKIMESFRELGIQGSLVFDRLGNVVTPLQLAEHAYTELKNSGIATYADLLKGQIALTEAQIDNARELGENTQEQEKNLSKLEDRWARLTGQVRNNQKQIDLWHKEAAKNFNLIGAAFTNLGQRGKQSLDLVAASLESAIAAAILGQQSFATALAQTIAKTLAAWSAQDAISAIRMTALGFAHLAEHDYAGAGQAFQAAAIYGAAAAAEGIAAAALGKVGRQGDQGSPSAPANLPPTPATTAGGGGAGPNIPRVYAGGLVSKRTLALIGDSRNGNAREGIIPLDDPAAMDAITGGIAERLNRQIGGAKDYERADIAKPNPPDWQDIFEKMFGGNKALSAGLVHTQINVYPKGDLVDLGKVIQKTSRMVKSGRARATASTALQVTKRA